MIVRQSEPTPIRRTKDSNVIITNKGGAAGGTNADVYLSADRGALSGTPVGTAPPQGLPLLTNQTPKAQVVWVGFPGVVWARAIQNDTDQIEVS